MAEMERYRKLFLEEGQKHLQAVEECLLEQDAIDQPALDAVFREIHSLKKRHKNFRHPILNVPGYSCDLMLDWRAGSMPGVICC